MAEQEKTTVENEPEPILGVDSESSEGAGEVLSPPDSENDSEDVSDEKVDSEGSQAPSEPSEDESLTPDQLQELQSKAALYEQIAKDPNLVDMILDYHKNPTGDTENEDATSKATANMSSSEIAELKKTVQSLMVQQQLVEFARTKTDFDEMRPEMEKVYKTHPNWGLQELYDYAKMNKSHQTPPRASQPRKSEGRTDGVERKTASSFEDQMKKIAANRNTKYASDYLETCFNEALRRESSKE